VNHYAYRVVLYCAIFLPFYLVIVRWVYYHEQPTYLAAIKEFFKPAIPKYKGRFFFLAVLMIVNTVIIWVITDNVEMYLFCMVASAISSLGTYTTGHLGKETITAVKERSLRNPLVYIVWTFLGLMCAGWWIFAIILFLLPDSEKTESPANSRERNRDCVLVDFYSVHDCWHLASAIALLTIALGLLHFDVDEITKPEDTFLASKRDKYSENEKV